MPGLETFSDEELMAIAGESASPAAALSDEALQAIAGPSMPQMTDAMDPVDRDRLTPFSGIPRASEVIPNPLDVPGMAARKLGLGPVLDWAGQPMNAAALLMPSPANPFAAGGINAAIQGVAASRDVVAQRMAQSTADSRIGRFTEAMTSVTPDDLWNVGARMLMGFGIGAGTAWGVGKLTGPMRPDAPSRVQPVGVRPSRTSPLGDAPLSEVAPLPRPSLPTDDQIAAVTARELQMDAKGAAQATVDRATGVPVPMLPGATQDAAIRAVRDQVPEPSRATVDAAYTRLRDAYQRRTGGDMVDVTDIVESLARTRAAIAKRSGTVPAAIDPADLKVVPQAERPGWLAGVMAPGGTRWMAPLETVQRKLSAINTLKNNAAERAASGLDVADLTYLSKTAYEGLRGQLDRNEPYLLDQATNAARMFGRLSGVQEVIDSTVNEAGIPQGAMLARKLLRDADGWRVRLGDLYEPTVTWARNVAKLQESEVGAAAVASLSKMAVRDHEAYMGTLASNAARGVTQAAAIPAAQAGNVGTAISQAAEIPFAQAGNLGAAISEAAQPAAVGASSATRAVTESMLGGAAGALAAHAAGFNPAYGAGLGAAGLGMGAVYANRIFDPIFRRGFDALARHPAGSQAFMQTLGRLGMLTYDTVAPLQPSAPAPTPFPAPSPTPRPLGTVGVR